MNKASCILYPYHMIHIIIIMLCFGNYYNYSFSEISVSGATGAQIYKPTGTSFTIHYSPGSTVLLLFLDFLQFVCIVFIPTLVKTKRPGAGKS